MRLFSRLLGLHADIIPLEDFFTELVAYLFIESPETLHSWIEHIGLLDSSRYDSIDVQTQPRFDPLEHHGTGSRPDIQIVLSDGSNRDMIVIESKIGSTESPEQLRRYAEILAERRDIRDRSLLYITRDFDAKDEAAILKGPHDSAVRFKQLRWYEFHQFLQSQPSSMLVDEIIAFMEEQGMAQRSQFSAVDLLALTNFPNAVSMMDATMWGRVSAKFEEVTGTRPQPGNALTQLQYGRYLMVSYQRANTLWCGLGYYLYTDSFADYPTAGLILEVFPRAEGRQKIIETMREISRRDGWQGYDLDKERAWSGVSRERSLKDFLSKEDHVAEIEAYFLELLEELAEIKEQYPYLPWRTAP